MPTRRRISGRLRRSTVVPPTVTEPRLAALMPLRASTSVVLPAPFGPRMATRSPAIDREVDAAQRLVTVGIGEGEVAHLQRRRGHRCTHHAAAATTAAASGHSRHTAHDHAVAGASRTGIDPT